MNPNPEDHELNQMQIYNEGRNQITPSRKIRLIICEYMYRLDKERVCVSKKNLEESHGIRAKEVFDLRVLRENLTAPGSVGFVCIGPEEVRRHYSLFFVLPLFPYPHFSPSLSLFLSPFPSSV
ncbi:hypothetical protein PanWU01x14_325440 [Parasponia andersonii]|uniref:Uncharacterized protein n=1 Tax=Parasponia andersonii TaxID=3476 RepID=A0A2P5AJR2_PARAD|nr:hypothetical protein PanWU01x14_325440 [Parasponia andersonii]